jgi:pyruvate dehydrogenase E2 component (dihydrolipoamide acetyltransferase)
LHKLHLPRLGQTMQQGKILRWFKQEGESFAIGDPLYEVESEKAVVPVEAKLAGTLARITLQQGDEQPVGALVAIVADLGETLSPAQIEAAIAEEQGAGAPATAPVTAQQAPVPTSAFTPASECTPGRIRVMPRARRLAEQLGVSLTAVQGTGAEGVITVEDVQRAASRAPSLAGVPAPSALKIRERRPLNRVGRTMAEVLTQSWQHIPQFVQMVLVDASALRRRRETEGKAIQQSHGLNLSYTDLILEAVIRSVEEVPQVNASFADDAIVVYEDINVSVAVATDEGLLVPVIHHAQNLSLGDLALQLREVTRRARTGSLTPEEMQGGTITVSNLGMTGVETGTPLVTRPQAAIVFIGAILNRPVAIGNSIEVRPTFYVSIGFDHRVVDGAAAAQFTGTVKRRLESL